MQDQHTEDKEVGGLYIYIHIYIYSHVIKCDYRRVLDW
jgi:hypothetical protein